MGEKREAWMGLRLGGGGEERRDGNKGDGFVLFLSD